jgi:hypothetical protein
MEKEKLKGGVILPKCRRQSGAIKLRSPNVQNVPFLSPLDNQNKLIKYKRKIVLNLDYHYT